MYSTSAADEFFGKARISSEVRKRWASPVQVDCSERESSVVFVLLRTIMGAWITLFTSLHGRSCHLVLAHISGKMRKRFIRLTIGDRVKMQMSPYDTAKARIVYRL